MKKILILGGTHFVGRILTENLLQTDHSLTLFNRGKTNPQIFPEARKISGDRLTSDIKKIAGESWDVVFDFSCMFPDNLDEITEILQGKVGRYVFISTLSVYPMGEASFWKDAVNEDSPILPCTPEQRIDKDVMSTYGEKKAECERILQSKEWLDSISFRPGLIYGRFDYTDRFYYWLYKIKTQKKVLIPDDGKDKFTHTHSIDLAMILQSSIDAEKHERVYNAVTHSPVSIKHFLDTAKELIGTSPEFINASSEFLSENNVNPWAELPIWLGGIDVVLSNERMLRDVQVKFLNFEESVGSTIEYYSSLGWLQCKYGLDADRETALMRKLGKE